MKHAESVPKPGISMHKLLQNDLKDLHLNELRDVFLYVFRLFVENLQNGKVDDLRSIRIYLRKIQDEIAIRDEIAVRDISGVIPNK